MKPKTKIWECFTEIKSGKNVKAKCKYCGVTYVTHVDRMQKHILNICAKVPLNMKKKIQVNHIYVNFHGTFSVFVGKTE